MKNRYKKGSSSLVVAIIIIVLAAAVGFYFYAKAPKGTDTGNMPTDPNAPVGFEENPQTLPSGNVNGNLNIPVFTQEPVLGAEVSIKDFAFTPTTVTIKASEAVQWVNNDSAPHTITSDTGLFDSGNESPGNAYTHVFDQAGTYAYHCSYHPNMKATVIVQ